MKIAPCFFLLFVAAAPIIARADEPKVAVVAADPWDMIKDYTYQKRGDFAAGTARLVDQLDGEIRQLHAKRASLPETSVKEWDFAMKELKEAHVYLKSTIGALDETTSETWNEAKERVSQAWTRAKEACSKVKASTTT